MNKYRKAGIILIVGVLAVLFMTVAFLTTQTNEDYFSCNLLMDLYCSRSEHGLDVSTSRKYQPGT